MALSVEIPLEGGRDLPEEPAEPGVGGEAETVTCAAVTEVVCAIYVRCMYMFVSFYSVSVGNLILDHVVDPWWQELPKSLKSTSLCNEIKWDPFVIICRSSRMSEASRALPEQPAAKGEAETVTWANTREVRWIFFGFLRSCWSLGMFMG